MTRPSQRDFAQKALEARQTLRLPERPAVSFPVAALAAETPRADYPPSGALDSEGSRPVLERSRKVR
jgi:hypothetical protein